MLLPLLLGAALAAKPGTMETITLKSGHTIRGEVLREKNDTLVVDVGVDVLKIPVKDVRSRVEADAKTGAAAGATAGGPVYGESGDLYATADLAVRPTRDLVNDYGEAVVLVKTPSGLGSGFIIDEKGHCITNCHVIEGETKISVDLFVRQGNSISERNIRDVEIVALSPFFDLALIKIPEQKDYKFKRTYLAGEIDEPRQGEPVFAVGNPLGLSRSVTSGTISNRSRNIRGQVFYQTDAPINPGNSGGPLFNAKGQVLGVNSLKITSGDGLGMAIPVSYVKDFLRNREAFAYNRDSPNTGFRYLDPPRRKLTGTPPTR